MIYQNKKEKVSTFFSMQAVHICALCILIVLCVFQYVIAAEKPHYPILSDKIIIAVGAVRTEPEGDIRVTLNKVR